MTAASWRRALSSAAALAAIGAAGAALIAVSHELTDERIAAGQRRELLDQLETVLPRGEYDNDPARDTRTVRAPGALGTEREVKVYRARRGGEPVALALTAVADGYGGPIRLLVGIRYDGRISGVRVLRHRETPGLGDRIEASRSDWIQGFEGRSLGDPPPQRWAVEADGGTFDQFTGATVTPRAVVNTLRETLEYFRRERATLFAAGDRDEDTENRP